MGQGGSIDDGGGDIFCRPDARRDRDLGEDWLDLVGDKDIFHQARDQAGFACSFVTTEAYAYCK